MGEGKLTVRFSSTGDHPLRNVMFVSMMIDGHDIHVDDVFARWIESSDGHFHRWKHASKSMSAHFIETEFDQVVERVHAQMDVTLVAVIRSMHRTNIN